MTNEPTNMFPPVEPNRLNTLAYFGGNLKQFAEFHHLRPGEKRFYAGISTINRKNYVVYFKRCKVPRSPFIPDGTQIAAFCFRRDGETYRCRIFRNDRAVNLMPRKDLKKR